MRLTKASATALFCATSALTAFACSKPSTGSADTAEANVESANDLFAASGAMPVRISAPFTTLWKRFKARQADPPKEEDGGPLASREVEYSEPGQLSFTEDGVEKVLDMRVYVRGESSKNDCPFPKVKIDFENKEQLKQTPFKGHGKIRVNTHCGPGDASARSGMGRVMNGVGPVREELTYRLIRAAGIATYRTRVLQVHYVDTADNTEIDTFAMAMETGDDAAQRFAKAEPPLIDPETGVYLDPGKGEVSWSAKGTPENEAQITVAEAFAGNKDWGGTHNVDAFGIPKAQNVFRIPQDFDLAAIALGDIARYGKGVAPVTDARPGLRNPAVAAGLKDRREAMEAAYLEAEKTAVEAKAVTSEDGRTTTDPGFLEARKRLTGLFDLPELQGGPV
ncbi:MAG TPA: hypothetical protein VM925_10080, partial [Labilithrix sp.]|nr:hypothetical protein [Labilithrix sp.]